MLGSTIIALHRGPGRGGSSSNTNANDNDDNNTNTNAIAITMVVGPSRRFEEVRGGSSEVREGQRRSEKVGDSARKCEKVGESVRKCEKVRDSASIWGSPNARILQASRLQLFATRLTFRSRGSREHVLEERCLFSQSMAQISGFWTAVTPRALIIRPNNYLIGDIFPRFVFDFSDFLGRLRPRNILLQKPRTDLRLG